MVRQSSMSRSTSDAVRSGLATSISSARTDARLRIDQRNAVLAGFLGWTLDAFDFFLLTYITADVARAFGRSVPEIAGVIAASLMMRPFGAIVFGLLADRYGRRLPLMLNVIFYAA